MARRSVLTRGAAVAGAVAAVTVLPGTAARLTSAHAASAAAFRLHTTSITINGTRRGLVFDGVGALSGGSGTGRLLIDYPEPERTQILDYLFKPGYGANVQVLKLEIGGDAEATDGAEPSFEHTKGHVNCNAGYEMWLARQARARNPHIRFYALQWNGPSWVGHDKQDPWTTTDIGYLLRWLHCAGTYHLHIGYLGGWDEHLPRGVVTPAIMTWFVELRAALNAHGYRYIKIVGVDSARRSIDVSSLIATHPAFRRAIGVLGYHDICGYPTTGRICRVPPAAKTSGKPIFATEIGALRAPGGPAAFARTINNAYIQAKAAAIVEFPLISAMPGGMPEEDRGFVIASQPWTGNYQVGLVSWATAQTTQFTQPGWVHVVGAAGSFGPDNGSYAAYEGPRRGAWTLVAQTSSATAARAITVHVTGGLPSKTVQVWSTKLDPANPAGWFQQRSPITPAHGTFTTTLRPGMVYTFTTTTGQNPGPRTGVSPPAATPMPLPYSTIPSGTAWPQSAYGPDGAGMPWGLEPADGSFEYPKGVTSYFEQTAVGPPVFWQPLNHKARFPYAVIGDYCLGDVPVSPVKPDNHVPSWCLNPAANYTVTATVRFTGTQQSAGVITRYYRPITSRIQYFQGYRLMVRQSGAWTLYRDVNAPTNRAGPPPVVLAHGKLSAPLGTLTSHTISLQVSGSVLTYSVDGKPVGQHTDATYSDGVAGIATGGWYPVRFLNVTITSP